MAKFSTRVKKLADLSESLENALNELLEDMESYYDSKNEKWQGGEKGSAFLHAKNTVSEAIDSVEAAFNDLNRITTDL